MFRLGRFEKPLRMKRAATASVFINFPNRSFAFQSSASYYRRRGDIAFLLDLVLLCIDRPAALMGLEDDFKKAAEDALNLPATTTNEDKLILYGLYKQATIGDVNTSRPGVFDLKGKAKWDAWNGLKGKSKEEAQQDYITKVTQLREA